jgi:acid phosphatase family membrane protein YuiD
MTIDSAIPGLPLLVSLVVQLSCQVFKFIIYSIRDGRVSPRYLTTAGGIPSAHSAFVVSLATGIAWVYGPDSAAFSVSVVFSLIVIYDAYRLRGQVQNHAIFLNRVIDHLKVEDQQKFTEMIGHSLAEIVWGIVYGAVVTSLFFLSVS